MGLCGQHGRIQKKGSRFLEPSVRSLPLFWFCSSLFHRHGCHTSRNVSGDQDFACCFGDFLRVFFTSFHPNGNFQATGNAGSCGHG